MAITLPLENQAWPLMRIVTKRRWGGFGSTPWTSSPEWKALPYEGQPGQRNGFRVLDYDRVCLPMIGRARFLYSFGRIDGRLYAPAVGTASSVVSGTGAAAGEVSTEVPDLAGWEVRIQGARPTTDGSDPTWRTVWWGEVDTQEDTGWPGSDVPAGERVYHCVDGLARIQRWAIDRHGFAATSGGGQVFMDNLRGHPGYNVGRDRDTRAAGNRWSGADSWQPDAGGDSAVPPLCYYHGHAGAADCSKWSDQQAIENALASSRRPGEPLFGLVSTTGDWDGIAQDIDRLRGESAWEISDGDNCMDLLTRILRRERGKGLCFLDWNDDSGDATGPLTVFLRVWPQTTEPIVYQDPTSSQVTIPGSTSAATNIALVDLIGDHRVVDSAFRLGDKEQFRLDALETIGEKIQVLVTLSYQDGITGAAGSQEGRSLRRRWSATDQTAFLALVTATQRIDERWNPVYQLHGLPLGWDCTAGDGNGGISERCDYRCGEDLPGQVGGVNNGKILAGSLLPSVLGNGDTSPLLLRIMDDLPLYEDWDYEKVPIGRKDGAAERANPRRRPIMGMLRVTTPANRFIKWEEDSTLNLMCQPDGIDLFIANPANTGTGARVVSATSIASRTYTQLVVTVAIELPHRVRFRTGLQDSNAECKRKATIYWPEHHLWLAHPGAIWDLNGTTGSPTLGHDAKRAAADANTEQPGRLRDDRSALARLHYLTWSWYGASRRTAAWGIRDCGSLLTFLAHDGATLPTDGAPPSSMNYATLGQTVDMLAANGEEHAINTPVTRIAYDHGTGVTTWSTDWNELDLA